jgi:ribA/ribD-fused uncharacterized protein
MSVVTFTKVSLENGWLGNMSRHPIVFQQKEWRSAEALFQAFRFTDPDIQEEIRSARSPFTAKLIAKKYADKMKIQPTSDEDYKLMYAVLALKLEANRELIPLLLNTGSSTIIEDVTKRSSNGRHRIWGMALVNGKWVGENMLGKLWMKLREEMLKKVFIHSEFKSLINQICYENPIPVSLSDSEIKELENLSSELKKECHENAKQSGEEEACVEWW